MDNVVPVCVAPACGPHPPQGEKTGGDWDGDAPVFSYSTYPEME